jgi:hypothetical protein
MSNKVLLKKSSVVGKVPATSDLDYGEVALNYADGLLYYKTANNLIQSFASSNSNVTLTGSQTLTNKTLTSPTINGATENNVTLTGTVTAGGVTGTSGYVLTSTGSGVQWSAAGSSYSLPTASTTTLGGVKVDGTTITIDGSGVISSAGGSGGFIAVITRLSGNISLNISGILSVYARNNNIVQVVA